MSTLNQILAEMYFSGDPSERLAIYKGQSAHGDLPLCLPLQTFFLHGSIRGGSDMGKTLEVMRQITNLCTLQSPQMLDHLREKGIRTEEYSILAVDQKTDNPSFNSNRIASRIAEMPFKFIDTRMDFQSYVYNPCEQSHHEWMSDDQIMQEMANAQGLLYSTSGYGPYYYTSTNLDHFSPVFHARNANGSRMYDSIRTLGEVLNDPARYLACRNGARLDQMKEGRHAAIVTRLLGNVHALNATRANTPGREAVFANAIDAMSLFHEKQFIHVTAPYGRDPVIGANIVNLLAYQIFNAGQIVHDRGTRKYRVIIVLDEAQHALSPQLVKLFEQARSFGVVYTLVHQHRDQLANIGGEDLRSHIDTNTGWSIDLDASTEPMIKWIQDHSPTGMRVHRAWKRRVETITDPNDSGDYGAPPSPGNTGEITLTESEGPIYSRGEILKLNSTGRVGWLRVRVNRGHLRICGVVPFYWQHAITEEQYRVLNSVPRPGPSASTITVKPDPFRDARPATDLSSPIVPKP